MWLQICRSTTLLAYPGLAFGAGILHLPMIMPSEADQAQVTGWWRWTGSLPDWPVSIPVRNGIGLDSNHDQPWPVRKATNITMESLGPASLDGRRIVCDFVISFFRKKRPQEPPQAEIEENRGKGSSRKEPGCKIVIVYIYIYNIYEYTPNSRSKIAVLG